MAVSALTTPRMKVNRRRSVFGFGAVAHVIRDRSQRLFELGAQVGVLHLVSECKPHAQHPFITLLNAD